MFPSRFTSVQPLAVGGTAKLYVAVDNTQSPPNHQVVLKQLFPNFSTHPTVSAMFRHEAQLLKLLQHDAIPSYVDYISGDRTTSPVLVLKYIPGCNLSDISLSLSIPLSLEIALQLLDVLSVVHTLTTASGQFLQIIHHDVTSANVRISPNGKVHLIDFGIATSTLYPYQPSSTRGTPGYTAPEIVLGSTVVDHTADLFSFGVLLYEITTGQRPFQGNSIAIMNAVTDGIYLSPSSLIHNYPPELEAIIHRCLSVNPKERFHSANAIASAITTLQNNVPRATRAELGKLVSDRKS